MTRELRLKFWTEVAEFYAIDKGLDIVYIKPWQIRLIGSKLIIDLYPVGEKVNIVGTLEYPIVEDIESFLDTISL